jgi:hypothetical protein
LSLSSITIPDSVTSIGDSSFSGCSGLISVTISEGVTSIGDYTFSGCSSLTGITIPEGITSIGGSAFYGCSSLSSITIPEGVTSIGYYAFRDCSSLSLFRGKFASEDGRYLIVDDVLISFASAGIKEYAIPDYVTSIGEGAFSSCQSLEIITIPKSVVSIGDYAFSGCSSLTSVYCKATTPLALGRTYVFASNPYSRKIYVPMESVEAYKSADGWAYYAGSIVGYDFGE